MPPNVQLLILICACDQAIAAYKVAGDEQLLNSELSAVSLGIITYSASGGSRGKMETEIIGGLFLLASTAASIISLLAARKTSESVEKSSDELAQKLEDAARVTYVEGERDSLGRPVGIITDSEGVLLAADDVGNIIWRVAPDTRAN